MAFCFGYRGCIETIGVSLLLALKNLTMAKINVTEGAEIGSGNEPDFWSRDGALVSLWQSMQAVHLLRRGNPLAKYVMSLWWVPE